MKARLTFSMAALMAQAIAGFAADQAKPAQAPPAVDVPPRQKQEGRVEQRRPEPIDKEKQEKLLEMGRKMRQEQNAVFESMRKVRAEIDALIKASPLDEKAIRAKASELGKLEGDAAMVRARHYHEVSQVLPKEQFERLQQVPPELQARPTNQALRLQSVATNRPPAIRPQSAPPARPATGQPQP